MSRVRRMVSKAEVDLTVELLRAMGVKIAATETTPGKVRVITTDGTDLTLDGDEENLDRELQSFRGKHGQGGTQGRA